MKYLKRKDLPYRAFAQACLAKAAKGVPNHALKVLNERQRRCCLQRRNRRKELVKVPQIKNSTCRYPSSQCPQTMVVIKKC